MVIVYQKHKRHTQYMSEAAHSTPQSSQDATSAVFMCTCMSVILWHILEEVYLITLTSRGYISIHTHQSEKRETLNSVCVSVNLYLLVATSHCYICQHRFCSQSHPSLFLSSLPLPLQWFPLLSGQVRIEAGNI